MKNLFCTLLMTAFILSSCSSDEPFINEGEIAGSEKQVVNITVNDVNEFWTDLRSTPISESKLKELFYCLSKEDGTIVHCKILTKQELLNGIKHTLPNGNYRASLLATAYEKEKENNNSHYVFDVFYTNTYDNMACYSTTGEVDYFFNEIVFEVKDSPISESMTLERITSKIEVVPQDIESAPKKIKSLILFVYTSDGQYFRYKTKNSSIFPYHYELPLDIWSVLNSKIYGDNALKNINDQNPIELLLLSVDGLIDDCPLCIRIEYEDDTYERVIIKSSYTLERNKILRLKGNLFNSQNTEIGGIEIEDEWEETVEDIFD